MKPLKNKVCVVSYFIFVAEYIFFIFSLNQLVQQMLVRVEVPENLLQQDHRVVLKFETGLCFQDSLHHNSVETNS